MPITWVLSFYQSFLYFIIKLEKLQNCATTHFPHTINSCRTTIQQYQSNRVTGSFLNMCNLSKQRLKPHDSTAFKLSTKLPDVFVLFNMTWLDPQKLIWRDLAEHQGNIGPHPMCQAPHQPSAPVRLLFLGQLPTACIHPAVHMHGPSMNICLLLSKLSNVHTH